MLGEHLRERAAINSQAPAILARGRPPLSYSELFDQVTRTVESLNRSGYGRGHRIGLALPPGPETAVAMVAVLAGHVCVPFNPASSAPELGMLLSRCRVDALITLAELLGQVVHAAAELHIPVIDLAPATAEPAGCFRLTVEPRRQPQQAGFSRDHELAAVFPTSGTTALPKLIPLTQAEVCCHGLRAMRYLSLTSADRCLDLLPPFHYDAIAASVLSTIFAGGSSVYPSAVSARHFLSWAREFGPSWCAVPPSLFPALLSEGQRDPGGAGGIRLRALFTCGAPIDEDTAAGIEQIFQAPLRNSYGATECGGISINPSPPALRKRGSVGVSVGPEIRIAGESGQALAMGEHGEVLVRGPGVFQGYEADPNENANTFFGEWYRTGDLGYLDGDGYLFLTGRIQEMINRGGEKIAPLEIDEVLRSHPDVEDAAAFAVPHPVLGEEVVAAVVLKPSAESGDCIHRFAAERLSAFKLPRALLLVPEIPKGPTGKVQRRRLPTIFADDLARVAATINPDKRS